MKHACSASVYKVLQESLICVFVSQLKMLDLPNALIVNSGIESINKEGVAHFTNGTTGCYDVILLSTGFLIQVPPTFESDGCTEDSTVTRIQTPTDVKELYKYCIHPQHSTLAFIGFARPQFGALTNVAEIQARWFSLLACGQRQLPPKRTMERHIDFAKRHATGRFASRGSPIYVNYIARTEVGCEPSWWRVLLQTRSIWIVWLMLNASQGVMPCIVAIAATMCGYSL
eukprot:SAG11_NODE_6912_length_1226_cov_2.449867_1_plen_229_part_00